MRNLLLAMTGAPRLPALAALLLATMLGACPPKEVPPPPIDEGYTDYRRGDLNIDSGAGAPTSILRKFAPQNDRDEREFEINQPSLFSVSLLQTYISDFYDFGNGKPESPLGDLVVLVNVGESETGGYLANPVVTSLDNGCSKPGVGLWSVFYSSDVHSNQFLNFANEPVYGPTPYCGRPVRIEVMIIRLNLLAASPEGDELRAKLRRLIAYVQGKTRATFSDQQLAEASGEIPENVLAAATMQRVGMLYSLVLMRPGGAAKLAYPRLEIGNYVLVRSRSRNTDYPPWAQLLIDNNTGRLVWATTPGVTPLYQATPGIRPDSVPGPMNPPGATQPSLTGARRVEDFGNFYRDRSYVTLQINKFDPVKIDRPKEPHKIKTKD